MSPLKIRDIPSWVVFQLLEKCNLRCSMCYEWGDTGSYHEHTILAELDRDLVLRTVNECLPAKPYFEFFGGEPLLYDGIWDVIALIRGAGCKLAFPTNGTLVERYAERLVRVAPTQLCISVDGPRRLNDQQRGRGVFDRVMRGIGCLERAKRAAGSHYPELGMTYVVTPLNHRHVAEFFLETIDLSRLAFVSIELQSFATQAQLSDYADMAAREFGVTATPCASGYVRDPAIFVHMDVDSIVSQMTRVRAACIERGVRFYSQPRTLDAPSIAHYLSAEWNQMAERRQRCGFPWAYAEISARGEVTTCHSFYDISIGNIHERSLTEIWRSDKAARVRDHLRNNLYSICTACCRYYSSPAAAVH
jgi:MoaA/NifB/PqqE/SkfB family radical SAM enzyme